MGITGGAYVPAEGGITTTNRWLRFDFDNPNHKALKILAGTTFSMGETIIPFDEDTSINLSDYISEPGADYYVFVNADKRVVCSTLRTQPDGYMFIGQFHTLCVDVGNNVTGIYPAKTGFQIGDTITLQNYFKERDLDFYNFYTKLAVAVNDGTPYAVVTLDHPLSGFKAGDILPESVWCLNWHPVSKIWDGMVWCNSANICVDIYLQSGIGEDTRSEYGAVHTVSRQYQNHESDLNSIGKFPITYENFEKSSWGSNQLTSIQGSTDQTYVGGHVDTNGRRMISFIGCEECCGYLNQETSSICGMISGQTGYLDGRGAFGYAWDDAAMLLGGSNWLNQGMAGTRHVDTQYFNIIQPYLGCRGCCDVTIV